MLLMCSGLLDLLEQVISARQSSLSARQSSLATQRGQLHPAVAYFMVGCELILPGVPNDCT